MQSEPVITVSHSQVMTWMKCKYAWKLSYLDKWTEKQKSSAMGQGSLFHALAASHFKAEPLEVQLDMIQDFAAANPKKRDVATRVATVFARYVHEYTPVEYRKRNVVAVEYPFEVVLRTPSNLPFKLMGFIDLITTSSGKMYIEDHKTHTSRPWTQAQVMMDSQLTVYGAAMHSLGYPVVGVSINLINMYDYKEPAGVPIEKLFKRVPYAPSEREFANVLVQFGNAVDEMIFYSGMSGARFTKHLYRDCDRCQFQEPCLMENKGFDPVPFLMTNFSQKEERPERDDMNEELRLL
jgi:RecB family exonuclease